VNKKALSIPTGCFVTLLRKSKDHPRAELLANSGFLFYKKGKVVDALVSGASAARLVSSTLILRTNSFLFSQTKS
jgi:hypothetical protein